MSSLSSEARGPTLRLLCINDIYTLEHLPRLLNLVRHYRTQDAADLTLVTLAGDFVGPSMLSSLDKGHSMMECLNAIGVTHVTFGNHEDDIEVSELRKRIAEFSGVWLGTNVADFVPPLPKQDIVTVQSPGGRAVRVGFLGVVMNDATVYRRPPFGGAQVAPLLPTVLTEAKRLVEEEGVCCVIPLTHQDLAEDRVLAQTTIDPPLPVIVGGHEHKIYLEQYGPTWLVKAGSDATHAAIVDLKWPVQRPQFGPDLPSVTVTLDDCARYPDDVPLRTLVNQRMLAVQELERATLLQLEDGVSLSSIGTRLHQTSVGTLLCSQIRDALGADGCLLNGGGVRGNSEYRRSFTYGNLKSELPFDNEVVVVQLTGAALLQAIVDSRAQAPIESGGFLQVDDLLRLAESGQSLLSVAGQPFDPARMYRIAIVRNLMFGMDHQEPLIEYAKQHPERVPPDGSGRDIKVVLVDAFSVALWKQLGHFAVLDTDQDGHVSPGELASAVTRFTAAPASSITVDLVMKAVDRNQDGLISRAESDLLNST